MSAYSPLELAKAFMQTGELEDALKALNQHIDAHPDDVEGRRMRADTLIRMRDQPELIDERLKQALEDLSTIKAPAPEHVFDLAMQKATLYEQLEFPEKAREVLRHALTTLSDVQQSERLTERLVMMLLSAHNYAEAQTLIDTMPRSWRWLQWRGDIAAKMGDFALAIEAYSSALALFTAHIDAMSNQWAGGIQARLLLARGDAYQRSGALKSAAKDYEAGMNFVPDDPVVKFKRGLLYIMEDELSTGLAECVSAYRQAKPALREIMESDLHHNTMNPDHFEAVKAALVREKEGK